MSVRILVRRATVGDARGIARVHVETWRSAYAGILPDSVMVRMSVDDKASAWRHLVQRQCGAEAVLVGAAGGNSVVGFASCGAAGPAPMEGAGEIHTLYVLPDWQERGIGRALLGGCFRVLTAAGFDSAFLWVLADNPSRFFYEAMGGKRVGERDEVLWGATLREAAYAWRNLDSLARRFPRLGVDMR
jgi:ribosomal protein S18 acetylase RimI-like enzyme